MGFLFAMLTIGSLGLAAWQFCGYKSEGYPTNNRYNDKHFDFSFVRALPGLALVLVFWTLCLSFTTIESGTIGVVYRNGRAVRTLDAGLHFMIPFVERSSPVYTKTLVVKPTEGGASNDLQEVTTEVTLAYHFDPQYAMYFATQLIDNSDNAVENKAVNPAIIEAVKAVTAKYTAQDLIQKRADVRDAIEGFVKERLQQYHIITETVSITDFKFSAQFNAAIEAKVTAQQQTEQAQNVLAKVRIEADQKIAAAQGEAAALRAQKEQITPELLQLRMIEMMANKWDGHLPQNYYGGSAPLPIVQALQKEK